MHILQGESSFSACDGGFHCPLVSTSKAPSDVTPFTVSYIIRRLRNQGWPGFVHSNHSLPSMGTT